MRHTRVERPAQNRAQRLGGSSRRSSARGRARSRATGDRSPRSGCTSRPRSGRRPGREAWKASIPARGRTSAAARENEAHASLCRRRRCVVARRPRVGPALGGRERPGRGVAGRVARARSRSGSRRRGQRPADQAGTPRLPAEARDRLQRALRQDHPPRPRRAWCAAARPAAARRRRRGLGCRRARVPAARRRPSAARGRRPLHHGDGRRARRYQSRTRWTQTASRAR